MRDAMFTWLERRLGTPLFHTCLLILFWLPHRILQHRAWTLPEEAYFEPLLAGRLLLDPLALGLLAVPVVAGAVGWKRCAWGAIDPGGNARILLGALGIVLAWAYGGMAFNPYFGQAHALDRLLIVLFVAASFRHPLFLAPALALATAFIHQVDYPTGLHSYTDKQPVFDMVNLFLAFLYLRLAVPKARIETLLTVALLLMAGHYFYPGAKKVLLLWPLHENLYYLVQATHDAGWLGFLEDDDLPAIGRLIRWTGWILLVYTLIVEVGAIAMLWRRWLAASLLAGQALLHMGIFAASGIFFWKWVLIDVALVGWLIRLRGEQRERVFGDRRLLLASLVLIAGAEAWMWPVDLGWYDTPLSDVFRFEGEAEDGRVYEIIPAQFAPYDFPVTQGRFYFVTERPFAVKNYGHTHKLEVLHELEAAETVKDVRDVIAGYGRNRYDPVRTQLLVQFLEGYFAGRREHGDRQLLPAVLLPPLHKYTGFARDDLPPWDGRIPLRRVRLRLTTNWLVDGRKVPIEDSVVLEVVVPPAASTPR